jgi:hypothetical protein
VALRAARAEVYMGLAPRGVIGGWVAGGRRFIPFGGGGGGGGGGRKIGGGDGGLEEGRLASYKSISVSISSLCE